MEATTIAALVNMGSAGAVIAVVILFLKDRRESETTRQEHDQKRDKEWRDFFTALAGGNEKDIQDMRSTANRLTALLEELLKNYNAHDTQAKAIATAIAEIRVELARLAPGSARRKAGTD